MAIITYDQYLNFDFTDGQAIFNFVVNHLADQGGPCMRPAPHGGLMCGYRNTNGDRACAAGCLIPDEIYDRIRIEMDNILNAALKYDLPFLPNIRLVERLQHAHDASVSDATFNWPQLEDQLRRVAIIFDLSDGVVERISGIRLETP